ncbi:LamG-like jellyroll fold domain-containing protein [Verrucomicrobiota bacterium]
MIGLTKVIFISLLLAFYPTVCASENPPDNLNVDVGDLDGDGLSEVLILAKRSVRSSNFKLLTWTMADGYVEISPPPVRTYRGYVQGNPNMRANASLNSNGTLLTANLSDGRALNKHLNQMPVSISGPSGTLDPGTGSTEITYGEDRISPTPLIGDIVPRVTMRKIGVGIDIWNDWWLQTPRSIEEAVTVAEQQINDTDAYYARDMGLAWELSAIVLRLDDYADSHKDAWNLDIAPLLPEHPDAMLRLHTAGNYAGGDILSISDPKKIVFSNVQGDWGYSSAVGHEVGHTLDAGHSRSWNDTMDRANSCLGSGNVERMIEEIHARATAINCPEINYTSPLAPHAREDAVNTMMDTSVDIDVLENDYDGNGDAISVTSGDSVSKKGGSVVILGNGEIRYTPPAHWVGKDFFYYTVTDATGIGNTRGYVVVYVRNNGLASHYTFEETSGFTAHDLGPYQAHGYALTEHFNSSETGLLGRGIRDNTDLMVHDTGDPLDGDMSVSLWVKYTSIPTEEGAILKKRRYRKDSENDPSAGWLMGHMQANGFSFIGSLQRDLHTDADFDVTSTDPIVVGTWYHLVMVIDRTNHVIRGWVNNTEVTNSRFGIYVPDGIIAKSHTPLQIMPNSNGTYIMDDLRIYNNALTPSEVAALYASAGTEDIAPGAPMPMNNSTDAFPDQALTWLSGNPVANAFDIYVGSDYDAVLNATTISPEYQGRQTLNEYHGSFPENTQYFWRVDELNGSLIITGDVWRFFTGGTDPKTTVANPGFETPVVLPYDLRPVINNWHGVGNTVWEGAPDVPDTPYGDNWTEPDYIFQKIGVWTPSQPYVIDLLLGAGNITMPFDGVEVSLHVGEGKEYVTSHMDLDGGTSLQDEKIASTVVAPNIAALGTSEEQVILNTGTGGQLGDVLWLRIGKRGTERVFLDNVRVAEIITGPVMFVSNDFVVQPDGITATHTLDSGGGVKITATIIASDSNVGEVSITQNNQFIGVLNDAIDEDNGNTTQRERIGTAQTLTVSFDNRVKIDGIALNNLLGTTTGREIAVVSSPALLGLNYGAVPEVFDSQIADIQTFGFSGSNFNFKHSTAASNIEPEILFGVDGYDKIILEVGQTLSIQTATTDGLPTHGGIGLDSFTVTPVLLDSDKDGVPDIFDSDDDGDGLPDDWEIQYFGSTTGAVAGVDSDGDGHDNVQEYITGSIPTNPGSVFYVSGYMQQVGGEGFVVEWNSLPNRYYNVLWSTNLTAGFQMAKPDFEYPQNNYTDSVHSTDSQGYYKVDVRLKP